MATEHIIELEEELADITTDNAVLDYDAKRGHHLTDIDFILVGAIKTPVFMIARKV